MDELIGMAQEGKGSLIPLFGNWRMYRGFDDRGDLWL